MMVEEKKDQENWPTKLYKMEYFMEGKAKVPFMYGLVGTVEDLEIIAIMMDGPIQGGQSP